MRFKIIIIFLLLFYQVLAFAGSQSITLKSEAGTGRGNTWVAGGATVGNDNLAVGGTESTAISSGLKLTVPLENSAVNGVILSVQVRALIYCTLCVGATVSMVVDDNTGSNTIASTFTPVATASFYSETYSINPITTNTWTWTEINNLNVGLVSAGLTAGSIRSDYIEIIVTYDPVPSLSITNPAAGNVNHRQGESFGINFTAADDQAANVSLFYDTDTANCSTTGTLITNSLNIGNTTYSWNLGSIPAGVYYICGVINDGVNPSLTSYSAGTITVQANSAPTLNITTPALAGDNVNQGANYTVNFTPNDSDADTLTISMYYDSNNVACQTTGTLLTNLLTEVDTSYVWDTTLIPSGIYYLCTITSDGAFSVESYSAGTLTISIPGNGPPTGSFSAPAAAGISAVQGDSVSFMFTSSDVDSDPLTISIYYDTDKLDCSTTGVLIDNSLDDTDLSLNWGTSAITPGTYWPCMVISDGVNGPVTVYATGSVTISAPPAPSNNNSSGTPTKIVNKFSGDVSCGTLSIPKMESKDKTLRMLLSFIMGLILSIIFVSLRGKFGRREN